LWELFLWHHRANISQSTTTGGFQITTLCSFDYGGEIKLIVWHLNFQQLAFKEWLLNCNFNIKWVLWHHKIKILIHPLNNGFFYCIGRVKLVLGTNELKFQ